MNDTANSIDPAVVPEGFLESFNALKEERKQNLPQRPKIRSEALPLKAIRFADRAFQPRTFEGNRADSEGHVAVLKEAIQGGWARNSASEVVPSIGKQMEEVR